MVGRPPDRRPYPLAFVNGGLNYRAGQTALGRNQTNKAKNISLLLEGGFTKTPGFTRVCTLPTGCKGITFYEKIDNTVEMIAYHNPYLSIVNEKQGIFSKIVDSSTNKPVILSLSGKPQFAQESYKGAGRDSRVSRLHGVDGVNNPFYYVNNKVTFITSWGTGLAANNNTQLSSVYARVANPTYLDKPIDVAFYANRIWYITKTDVGRAIASKAGDGSNFIDNSGSPVPIDIPIFVDFPVQTPFTAIESTANGLMFYEMNGTSRMIGENAPINGLPNQFEFQKMNSTIGALSPNLACKLTDNEHLVLHNTGLYNIKITQNFAEVKPGELSYYIQPAFDALGRSQMQKGEMIIAPHLGLAMIALPRTKRNLYNTQLFKYFYGVGQNSKPKTTPWMLDKFFGGNPTRFDAMAVHPKTNEIYFAVNNIIYKWKGNAFLPNYNGITSPIQSEYEFPPLDFDLNGIDKYITAYYISYKSSTSGTFYLDHAWDNGDDGRTRVDFSPSDASTYPATPGTTTFSSRSSYEDVGIRIPISGGQIGKQLVVTFLHEATDEDITIYDIGIEYEVL